MWSAVILARRCNPHLIDDREHVVDELFVSHAMEHERNLLKICFAQRDGLFVWWQVRFDDLLDVGGLAHGCEWERLRKVREVAYAGWGTRPMDVIGGRDTFW